MIDNTDVHFYGSINRDAEPRTPTHAYRRRWYIVIIFAFFAMEQGAVSNTWGPIADTVSKVYGWNTSTIAILSAWNNIIFLLFFLPMVKLMMKFGLRKTTLFCALAMTLSTGIRCIPANEVWTCICAHISAILCGFSNTLGMIGPTALSVTWFPVHQRTLATAIVSVSNNNLANVGSFLLAKMTVKDYNTTVDPNVNGSIEYNRKIIRILRDELKNFMVTEFAVCFFIFIAIVLYFPRRPKLPPSSSAVTSRVDYKAGFLKAIKMRDMWLIMVPYALPLGVQPAFMTVMDSILFLYGIDQDTSNWIGFYSALCSACSGVVFSWIADRLRRHTKGLLIASLSFGGLSYFWFTLIAFGIFPFSIECVYVSLIFGGVFSNGAVPLLYEMACEITYPVSEEVTTGIMTAFNNLSALVFLSLVSVDSLGKTWVLWSFSGTFLISLPSLIAVRAEYRRMNIENSDNDPESDDSVSE